VLYVGAAASGYLVAVLESVERRPVLTVSHRRGFARRGVHINFFVNEKGNLRFEVNAVALASSGLRISHLLLGVASIVDPARPE
jgi:hypothetical protein